MRVLDVQPLLGGLPPSVAEAASRLNPHVSADDGMYEPDGDAHYLSCGASALNVVLSALQVAAAPPPGALLDFGAGAGRVTRWLRAAFPQAAIAACDLRPQDMRFCEEEFGAETWVSGTDVAALRAPRLYDLIWVGSVLTHLPAETSGRLIDTLLSWTNPGGVLVMSTIGRTARQRRDRAGSAYIHEEGWNQVLRQYDETGFGYADYEGSAGYGLSLTRLSWTSGLVESLPGTRLVLLAEAAWDGLHDIVAIQNIDPAASLPAKARDQGARFAADRNGRLAVDASSTIGRVMAPLRVAVRRWRG